MMRLFSARFVAIAAGTMAFAGYAAAGVIWSGTSGNLAASAEFSVVGDILSVRLSNTSTHDVLVPADVLTGVFFGVSGTAPTFTRLSAVVPSGHTVLFGTTNPGGVVSGEWGYVTGKAGAPGGLHYGISAAGLGLFGPGDIFPGGTNLQGPVNLNGLEYGITSAGDNPATGNTPVTGTQALIKSAVVFTFSGATGFDTNRVNGVIFQYGTALYEPSYPGSSNVPAPGSVALIGVAALVISRRRR